VTGLGAGGGVLAERHDVHVVVDQHGSVDPETEPGADGEAVPAGHQRRIDGVTAVVVDGAGQADGGPADVGRAVAALGQQLGEVLQEPAQAGLGTPVDGEIARVLSEYRAAQVGDGEPGVGDAEVGGEHDPGARVEDERRGGPAS
jgi:hypothetical protein